MPQRAGASSPTIRHGATALREAKEATLTRYAMVIEKAQGNYSDYVPDLPGCVATGATVEAVAEEIREAIRFHLNGLQEDGLPIPPPTSIAAFAEI
jgi:predicted RNase H-like HicB family nuclease